MSKRASPALIGVFVLLAMVLGVVSLMLFGSGRFFNQKEAFVLYFEDSLNGLDVGAPVKFKGVPIGEVTGIFIRLNQAVDSPHIPVTIAIDTDHLQEVHNVNIDLSDTEVFYEQVTDLGLRGTLQQASFVTGKLYVQLDYYPEADAPEFVQLKDPETGALRYKEIATLRSDFTEMIQKVSGMINDISAIRFEAIGIQVSSILAQVDEKLTQLDVLKLNAELEATLRSVRTLLSDPEVMRLATEVNQTLEDYQKVAASVDVTLVEARELVATVNGEVAPVLEQFSSMVTRGTTTLETADTLLQSLNRQLSPGAPVASQLERTLSEVSQAARSLRQLADYLEQNPNALLTGR
jgi:paraquat-inducible protein B